MNKSKRSYGYTNTRLSEMVREAERKILVAELATHEDNRTRTSAALGISRRTLLHKIKYHQLPTKPRTKQASLPTSADVLAVGDTVVLRVRPDDTGTISEIMDDTYKVRFANSVAWCVARELRKLGYT